MNDCNEFVTSLTGELFYCSSSSPQYNDISNNEYNRSMFSNYLCNKEEEINVTNSIIRDIKFNKTLDIISQIN